MLSELLNQKPANLSAKRTPVANLQNMWNDSEIYGQILSALLLFKDADPVEGLPPNELATDMANNVTVDLDRTSAKFGLITVGQVGVMSSFEVQIMNMNDINDNSMLKGLQARKEVKYPATLAVLFAQYTVMQVDNVRALRADVQDKNTVPNLVMLINRAKAILHTSAVYDKVEKIATRDTTLTYIARLFNKTLDTAASTQVNAFSVATVDDGEQFIELLATRFHNQFGSEVSVHLYRNNTRVSPLESMASLYIIRGPVELRDLPDLTILASLYQATTTKKSTTSATSTTSSPVFATFTPESNTVNSLHFAVATQIPATAWVQKTVQCLLKFTGKTDFMGENDVMTVQNSGTTNFLLAYNANEGVEKADQLLISTTAIHQAWMEMFVTFMAVRILYCAPGISKNVQTDIPQTVTDTEKFNREAILTYCRNPTRSLLDRIDDAYKFVKNPLQQLFQETDEEYKERKTQDAINTREKLAELDNKADAASKEKIKTAKRKADANAQAEAKRVQDLRLQEASDDE